MIETLLPCQPQGRKGNKSHFSESSSRKDGLRLFSLIFNLNFIHFFQRIKDSVSNYAHLQDCSKAWLMWYKVRIKGCIILGFHYSHFSSAIFCFLSFKKHWSETSPRSETLSLCKNTRGNASKQQGFCSPETHIQETELPSSLLHHPADEKVGRVAQENFPIVNSFQNKMCWVFLTEPRDAPFCSPDELLSVLS